MRAVLAPPALRNHLLWSWTPPPEEDPRGAVGQTSSAAGGRPPRPGEAGHRLRRGPAAAPEAAAQVSGAPPRPAAPDPAGKRRRRSLPSSGRRARVLRPARAALRGLDIHIKAFFVPRRNARRCGHTTTPIEYEQSPGPGPPARLRRARRADSRPADSARSAPRWGRRQAPQVSLAPPVPPVTQADSVSRGSPYYWKPLHK